MTPRRDFRIAKVGVAMAVYRPDILFLARQLVTIREQAYTNWVCVITSDSPLDEFTSDPRILPFMGDLRFVWLQNGERLGHKKNFERAIQEALARGAEAIACSDQDDVWYPEKLAVLVEELRAAGPLSLVHSDLNVFEDEARGITIESAWRVEQRGVGNARPRHLFVRNVVTGCSMIFDAELARRFPVIPAEVGFHDHWYAITAASCGIVVALPRPLLAYRQHASNVLGARPFIWNPKLPPGNRLAEEVNGRMIRWREFRGLVLAAMREGVPVGLPFRMIFLWRLDQGFGFILAGLAQLGRDRPLARLRIRIGIGKFADGIAAFGRLFRSRRK
ncbi:MAG: methyltransferase protein [Chlorobi bacterium]|nr:methyltransferase protein [Chlorobiota bacterium]